MEIPYWVVNSYDCIPHEQIIEVQDEVVNLQHDVSMRNKFSKLGLRACFCHDIMEHYTILRSKLHMFMLPFPAFILLKRNFASFCRCRQNTKTASTLSDVEIYA
ncbi:hypothetical protein GJ496_000792 [Pomphorhynchus laevis]|nr:hypothetical protein GJ496_000792 [Pomphorhynchus laevis]